MNVLTSLNQLEGKTIKHINVQDSYDSEVFILTEDKAVALLTFEVWENDGITSVKSNLIKDELELFMHMEEELIKYGVISKEESKEYYEKIFEESKLETERLINKAKEKEYGEYLRLKRKYEVTYKL